MKQAISTTYKYRPRHQEEFRIFFPRRATVAYMDSFLRADREIRALDSSRLIFDLSRTSEVSSLLICFLCGLVDVSREKNNRVAIVLPRNGKAAKAIQSVRELIKKEEMPIRVAERMCQARKITGNNNSYLDEILDLLAQHLRPPSGAKEWLRVVLTELLTNAIDHSGEKSCYLCAGAWGRSRSLHVTMVDFGVGIAQKLRTRYPEPKYENDVTAIRDVLEKGLTTRTGMEGGRGYKFIQEILRKNRGRLHIFSGGAKTVLKYDKSEYNFKKARRPFTGTCVDIEFNLSEELVPDFGQESQQEGLFR